MQCLAYRLPAAGQPPAGGWLRRGYMAVTAAYSINGSMAGQQCGLALSQCVMTINESIISQPESRRNVSQPAQLCNGVVAAMRNRLAVAGCGCGLIWRSRR